MIVKEKGKRKAITFGELVEGTCFYSEFLDILYLKVLPLGAGNAVNLKTNCIACLHPETKVVVVNAHVEVED